jgi:hypothetical protein
MNMQIRRAALQIQHWINNDLARQMVGHLTTSIDVMQRMWRLRNIEMEVIEAGSASEGVAGGVLQDPDRLRCRDIGHQPFPPATLIPPGDFKGDRIRRLETNCSLWVCRCAHRI